MKKFVYFVIIPLLLQCITTGGKSITTIPEKEIQYRQDTDLQAIKIYRRGLQSLISFVKKNKDLFPGNKRTDPRILPRNKRNEITITWHSLLDHYLALDSIDHFHRSFQQLPAQYQSRSFIISKAAFYTKYRFALELLAVTGEDRTYDIILNEKIPELGFPHNTYSDFKLMYLNVVRATEFAAFELLSKGYNTINDKETTANIRRDRQVIWSFGKGKGEKLTMKNGLAIIRNKEKQAWFPVQKGFANAMGDIKVYRQHKYLISNKQIESFKNKLLPGDILLERRDWYLSNIGIPGFWTHAALYIGTREERTAYFSDPDVKKWLAIRGQTTLDAYLQSRYPSAYQKSLRPFEDGHPVRIIEAIGEGVLLTSLHFSAGCDSLAVLRPRLSKKEKAIAISRAFKYSGRPYDFDFDFITDSALVCTELVYKSYEPGSGTRGIRFKFQKVLGKKMISANAIAEDFSLSKTSEQQYDFVMFYDGYEKTKKAYKSTEQEFIKSWKRPKWHVLKEPQNVP